MSEESRNEKKLTQKAEKISFEDAFSLWREDSKAGKRHSDLDDLEIFRDLHFPRDKP